MNRKNWTPEARIELKKLRDLGLTIREISEHFGVSWKSVETALRRYRINHPTHNFVKSLETPDLKESPDIKEFIDLVIKSQDLIRRFDPRQREVFPEYKTGKWVGIPFLGDGHFEHYKTDQENLIKDLESIGEKEDVLTIFNGDFGNWSDIRFPGYSHRSVVFPMRLRYQALYHLIDKIRNLLAITTGCHDDWINNRAYFDIVEEIQKRRNEAGLKTYYLGYGGTVNLKVGKVLYRIAIYHKYRGESKLNIFQPCINYLRDMDATADVVCVSHRHDKCGISYQYYQHQPKVLIRSGSRQYLTDYAWKEGFAGAIARFPMILLNSQEKQVIACPNYKEGMEELKRLNKA